MALSATFTANFSSFYDAVDKADAKLKDFGAGADKVGGRLNALGNQFSGVKIVQDATLDGEGRRGDRRRHASSPRRNWRSSARRPTKRSRR